MKKIMGTALVAFFLFIQAGHASLVTSGAKEIAEAIMKQGSKEGLRELAEYGGNQAIQEALERVARDGGDELVAKAVKFGKAHGVGAIKTIERAPTLYIKSLEAMPKNLVQRAFWAAQRDPLVMERLMAIHGPEALGIAARFRGVGAEIMIKLGDNGIQAARELTESQAVVLARHADDIAVLPGAQRQGVLQAMTAAPGRILEYLEQHPRILMTSAGVGTVIALKDDVLGVEKETVINPDGSVRTRTTGFVERIATTFQTPLTVILALCAAIVGGWGAVNIWGCYRLKRIRVVQAEQATAKTKKCFLKHPTRS